MTNIYKNLIQENLEIKNRVIEIRNTMNGINSRLITIKENY